MASVRDYMRPCAWRTPNTIEVVVGETVEVNYDIDGENQWFAGVVLKVTPTRCQVEIEEDGTVVWLPRWGDGAKDLRKPTVSEGGGAK